MSGFTNVESLVKKADEINLVSNSDMMNFLLGSYLELPLADEIVSQNLDPFSEEYLQKQHEIYCQVANMPKFTLENAKCYKFDIDNVVQCPFPYSTKDYSMVGDTLIATGFIIKCMKLPTNSNILEFGSGFGGFSLELARMGYNVTALDIDGPLLEVVKRRAKIKNIQLSTHLGDFSSIKDIDREFDAYLFYESFNHCFNFLDLVKILYDKLGDSAIIVFSGEPIVNKYKAPWGIDNQREKENHEAISKMYPWGVNLGGLAVYTIRKFGWIELIFDESFFIKMLMRTGFNVERNYCQHTVWGHNYIARKSYGQYPVGEMLLPYDEEATWWTPEKEHRWTKKESEITLSNDNKWKHVNIDLSNPTNKKRKIEIRSGHHVTKLKMKSDSSETVSMEYDPATPKIEIKCNATWNPKKYGSTDERDLGIMVKKIWLET